MTQGVTIRVVLTQADYLEEMKRDLRAGLDRHEREIPPKYFYDARGSELFDQITELPEYYLTRVETALLGRIAGPLAARAGARELVELGPGYGVKTRVLLDALAAAGRVDRYVALDMSETALRAGAARLAERYPDLAIEGIVADFSRHLSHVPPGGDRLYAFLGSTIGNFDPDAAVELLSRVMALLGPRDHLLVGADLVKDLGLMEDAYNDPEGITAEFNKNILLVVNEQMGSWLNPDDFEHVAFYDDEHCWIEMRLRSKHRMMVRVPALDAERPYVLEIDRGEEIRTEISCKYTREVLEGQLRRAGLEPLEWHEDEHHLFALSLSRRP